MIVHFKSVDIQQHFFMPYLITIHEVFVNKL